MQTSPRLQMIVSQIAQKHGVDLDRAGAYLRLELPGNGQLVIENIGANRVSMTNYIEVNRDLIADPQVVLYTQYNVSGRSSDPPEMRWAPLEINELFGGWRLYAEVDLSGRPILYDAVGQAQLAELCDRIVARSLSRFGWLHLAQRATVAPKPWRVDEIYERDIRVDEMPQANEDV